MQKNKLSDEQLVWSCQQPWQSDADGFRYVSYALGSWWAVKTSVLDAYDWPPADLQQKGGDIMLGELFRQRNLQLCHFRDGVRINVNDAGVEGAVPRTIV